MFQFIRVVTVGKRDERREEYNQIIKRYIFSPQSSASVGLQLGFSWSFTLQSEGSGEWSRVLVVVVVVVPGRNAGDVLRLLGIQPQLGTVMLPVLS